MQINTLTNIKEYNFILYLKNFKIGYESYKKYMKLKNEYKTENKMKHISTSCKSDTFLVKLSQNQIARDDIKGYLFLFVIMIQFV